MNSPDQDTLVRALEDARRILAEHLQPEPCDPARTMERLLVVLDKNEVVLALDRVGRRRTMRLSELCESSQKLVLCISAPSPRPESANMLGLGAGARSHSPTERSRSGFK
jgi:hypothetical protein